MLKGFSRPLVHATPYKGGDLIFPVDTFMSACDMADGGTEITLVMHGFVQKFEVMEAALTIREIVEVAMLDQEQRGGVAR